MESDIGGLEQRRRPRLDVGGGGGAPVIATLLECIALGFFSWVFPLFESLSHPVVGVFLRGYWLLVSDFVRCASISVDADVVKSTACGSSICM
ncbi:hypothetical protein RHMOL_Rhmol08G0138700 [Rhododendron molle]|uniref:Uncharacterized protein n=1 Tax=Rhododendron molle TaxID=49168 RepID=A0ACC0MPF2_RHOML|nr:hypothetical protein RHMOL_Rhmol08G0138700 [Rhododendron molle]